MPRWNAGRPVFRVARSKAGPVVGQPALAAVGGMVLGMIAAEVAAGHDAVPLGLAAGVATGGLVGLASGIRAARRLWDLCSDAECREELPPGLAQCPQCGGTISGRIRSDRDRLDAEEVLTGAPRDPEP